jgi:hypothetical protein
MSVYLPVGKVCRTPQSVTSSLSLTHTLPGFKIHDPYQPLVSAPRGSLSYSLGPFHSLSSADMSLFFFFFFLFLFLSIWRLCSFSLYHLHLRRCALVLDGSCSSTCSCSCPRDESRVLVQRGPVSYSAWCRLWCLSSSRSSS